MGSPTSPICVSTLLFALFALLLTYGFFVLCSIAITRSRSSRLRELARSSYPGARYARLVLTQADPHLLSCHIGTFLSALLSGLVLQQLVERFLDSWLHGIYPEQEFLRYGLSLSLFVLVACFLGIGIVQIAKAIGFSRPTRSLCILSLPLIIMGRITSPIAFVLRMTVGNFLKFLGVSVPVERELAVSAEEISEIVEISSKAGEIEEDEREMIQHVFTFSDTIVREVMTPRKDIISVEETTSLQEVLQVFVQERLSRILVTGSNLDDVKGVIIAKDLLPFVGREFTGTTFEIKKLMRPAYFVSNSKKVDELLKDFRKDAVHFAVVLDEHGGVDGVVTLEDLVEEIVGEIFDEFDSPQEELDVRETQSGDLLVDGSMIIDNLNFEHKLNIPKGDYDTLAGFVIERLGHIPKVGEVAEYDGLLIRVEETEQNRITQLRISLPRKKGAFAAQPQLAAVSGLSSVKVE